MMASSTMDNKVEIYITTPHPRNKHFSRKLSKKVLGNVRKFQIMIIKRVCDFEKKNPIFEVSFP